MERAYNLQQDELQQQQQLEMEQRDTLAQFGALTLQLEQVRARLPQIEERQRSLITQVARRHSVANYLTARIVGANLICQLPDPAPDDGPAAIKNLRPNGAAAEEAR
jgi:Tfp pilus assembly protein PilO